ncbi:MAG: hemerythrin domain-containing protein [Firmicutes bacterium]|nr:hemerythrin domain-containing protein [Bacillota bacterium]
MSWMKRFHDDHMFLVQYLPKFEGNLKDIEHGLAGHDVKWELREFADLIVKVIRPHFEAEEKGAYREAAGKSEDISKFIDEMMEEHRTLYAAFDGFIEAVEKYDRERIVRHGKEILSLLKGHIEKEEIVVKRLLEKEKSV